MPTPTAQRPDTDLERRPPWPTPEEMKQAGLSSEKTTPIDQVLAPLRRLRRGSK